MGFDLQQFLTAKRGPFPTWVYVALLAAVAGFFLLRPKSKTAAADGSQGGLATGTGSYSTDTTDANGNTTSSTYSGPAYSPGFLSTQATQPPSYGQGDIYVNVPGNVSQGQGSIPVAYPPPNPPAAGPGRVGSFWYTPTAPMDTATLERTAYQLGPTSDPNLMIDRSVDAMKMVLANPQIDWSQVVPAGTPVFMPLVGGVPGKTFPLPDGGNQVAPATYQPPTQQTSVSLIPSAIPTTAVPASARPGG